MKVYLFATLKIRLYRFFINYTFHKDLAKFVHNELGDFFLYLCYWLTKNDDINCCLRTYFVIGNILKYIFISSDFLMNRDRNIVKNSYINITYAQFTLNSVIATIRSNIRIRIFIKMCKS